MNLNPCYHSGGRDFLLSCSRVVEKLVSRLAHNQEVVGSSPTVATTFTIGRRSGKQLPPKDQTRFRILQLGFELIAPG